MKFNQASGTHHSARTIVLVFGFTPCLALLLGCLLPVTAETNEARQRVRDLGITIGQYAPGPLNAITDVEGVKVGQRTLMSGEGPLKPGEGPVRTGVTVVIPREDVWHKKVDAGCNSYFWLSPPPDFYSLAAAVRVKFLPSWRRR